MEDFGNTYQMGLSFTTQGGFIMQRSRNGMLTFLNVMVKEGLGHKKKGGTLCLLLLNFTHFNFLFSLSLTAASSAH